MSTPLRAPTARGACDLIPGGAQTNSKTRYPSNGPTVATAADGAYVWAHRPGDRDGRGYVDHVCGLGPVILGHGYREVDEAAEMAIASGICYPLPSDDERALAQRLVGLTHLDMARFGKNGCDVTGAAIRLARAHTGRDHVVMMQDGYHGHHDWSITDPMAAGVPQAVRALTHRVPRELDAIGEALDIYEPACVILEPVLSSDPALWSREWFADLRDYCDAYGTLLVLDEIVTGFRMGLPGGMQTYDIKPDLACFGKALGNGYPISALVGKREIMQRIAVDVFFSTTFGGDAIGLAAALATLDVLERERVPDRLAVLGKALMAHMNAEALRNGLAGVFRVYGYPQRPVVKWATPELREVFLGALVEHGVLVMDGWNLMLAHEDPGVQQATYAALTAAFEAVGRHV